MCVFISWSVGEVGGTEKLQSLVYSSRAYESNLHHRGGITERDGRMDNHNECPARFYATTDI